MNKPLAMIVVLVCVAMFWLATGGALWLLEKEDERVLFAKLEAAIDGGPTAEQVKTHFGPFTEYSKCPCPFDDKKIGQLIFESDLRGDADEIIFVAEDFENSCISMAKAVARFDLEPAQENCSHGGCWSRSRQYDWGVIGFGVDRPDAQCASSVVINSEQYQRP